MNIHFLYPLFPPLCFRYKSLGQVTTSLSWVSSSIIKLWIFHLLDRVGMKDWIRKLVLKCYQKYKGFINKVVFLNCDRTTFYQGYSWSLLLCPIWKLKDKHSERKGLDSNNSMWLFLFCLHYFTILAERVLKYCKIRNFNSGIFSSTAWCLLGFCFLFSFLLLEGIDSQAVKAHCITDWPRRRAQRLCTSRMVLTSNCRARGPVHSQLSTILPHAYGLGFVLHHLQFQVRIFKLLKVKCVHASTLHKGQKQAGAMASSLEEPELLEPLPVGASEMLGTQPGSCWHFLTFSPHSPW